MRICIKCGVEKCDDKYSGPRIKYCKDCQPKVLKERRDEYFSDLKEDIQTGKRQYIPLADQNCITCGIIKPICEFAIQPRRVTGRSLECKQCKNKYNREYSKRTRDKNIARCKKFYTENREYVIRETRKWAVANPEKIKIITSRCQKKRYAMLKWNLSSKVSSQIRIALKKNGFIKNKSKWRKSIGYTINELRSNLESKFTEGMSWDKFIDGKLELEHIIPQSSFYFESENDEDFKKCWSLNNLTLSWKIDNRKKSDIMSDGKRGRSIGDLKKKYLNEEFSLAGFELTIKKEAGEDLTG
jgi:hypothetical protein